MNDIGTWRPVGFEEWKGAIMVKHRHPLCRICHKNPVWTNGDVKDAQGTCKKCYHKHVWAGNPRPGGKRGETEADGRDGMPLWEIGMEAEIEALGRNVRPEDLW